MDYVTASFIGKASLRQMTALKMNAVCGEIYE